MRFRSIFHIIQIVCLIHACGLETYAQVPQDGLQLWISADYRVDTTGNRVNTWSDRNGLNLATTKTDNKPILVKDANWGFPSILFNGKDQGMETMPIKSFPGKRGCIAIVARINGKSHSSGAGFSTFISTYYGHGHTWEIGASVSAFSFYDGEETAAFPKEGNKPTRWNIILLSRENDHEIGLSLNGSRSISIPITDNQPDINTLKIGFNDSAEVLNGQIAEILMYERNLTKDERKGLNQYLSGKYHIVLEPEPFWMSWWFYSLLLGVFLLCAFLVNSLIRQRKLKNELKELEKDRALNLERQRISREMHDDIGAGLTQISLISNAAILRAKSGSDISNELSDIAGTSRQLVDNIGEIVWALNPQHGTLEILLAHLREQLINLLEYAMMKSHIRFPDTVPFTELDNQQKRNILLVVKEIVHNAVKHSHAENLWVHAVFERGTLLFDFRDDGTGFDPVTENKGNGLRNLRLRVSEINGSVIIDSAPGKGTHIVLRIPLTA